jgi:excisionase family DNA binding protein
MENIHLEELAEKVANILKGKKEFSTPLEFVSFRVGYNLILKQHYAEGTIRNKIRQNTIPFHKQGGSIKFKISELQEWIDQKHKNL